MRRKFIFSINEYYHIYNRGTEKRIIFTDTHDYNRFLTLLYICNSRVPVDIGHLTQGGLSFLEIMDIEIKEKLVHVGVYCLMPNHFHLLLKETQENGISIFMKKLLTAYAMYFNNRHKRSGRLFQGPFLARHADTDKYLKYLFSYIHLNPIKLIDPKWKVNGIQDYIAAKNFLNKYFQSSYLDYVGRSRKEGKILDKTSFPEYFLSSREFSQYIEDWIDFKEI